MLSDPNIAVLILAAGCSSRMGKPKQLLPWKGATLLENALKSAQASRCKTVCVVLGANVAVIRERISKYKIEIVENTSWASGLGSSIAVGVAALLTKKTEPDGVLIMLADQPLIDSDYLNLLIETFLESEKTIVATAYKNRAGVPALFDRKYFDELMQLVGDSKGAKNIIERYSTEVHSIDSKKKSIDVDTPSEYKELINTVDKYRK